MNTQKTIAGMRGTLGEDLACSFLIKQGMTIIQRNFRVKGGEIDIIARDGRELVFIEVKTRTSKIFGYPEEAVTRQKLTRCMRAIRVYLMMHQRAGTYRCDVIAVDLGASTEKASIHHIRNIDLPRWG